MPDKNDPQARPAAAAGEGGGRRGSTPESYGLYYQEPPVDQDANGKAWYTRNQNLLVNYIEAAPGASFSRKGHKDEYMIVLPDEDTPYEITALGETREGPGYQVIVVPPGDSEIRLPRGGRIVRLFTTQSDDLNAKCANAATYAEPDPNVAPFTPWPEPPAGYRLRVYDLWKTREPGQYGPVWRCTTIMLSFPPPIMVKRDTSRMSPHSHADFDQCSLVLNGTVIHHMRWMWGLDQADWREDVHALVGTPSATMIPAKVIHTSARQEPGNRMCDIFAPPRFDFSRQPGWVRNAEDYPMPEEAAD